jgi:hypothetical protein
LRFASGITLEDFSAASGLSMHGVPNRIGQALVEHGPIPEHDESLRGARIVWDAPRSRPFLELRFAAPGSGLDLGRYTHLEFRMDRAEDPANPVAPSAVSVRLLNADGTLSEALDVASYGLVLDGPVGGPYGFHSMLQTARVPLADFEGATLQSVLGARFDFPSGQHGALYLANLRASLGTGLLGGRAERPRAAPLLAANGGVAAAPASVPNAAQLAKRVITTGNRVLSLRLVEQSRVEIELASEQAFQVKNDPLVLSLGALQTLRSRHPDGDLRRIVFSLDLASFLGLAERAALRVRHASNDALTWEFGPLDKTRLQR